METAIHLDSKEDQLVLFGSGDTHLRLLRKALGVKLIARDGNLVVVGDETEVNRTIEIVDQMQIHVRKHHSLTADDITEMLTRDYSLGPGKSISVFANKKTISASTKGQLKYIETMLANDLTFCIGPAGTGKTYLAVAVAVSMLKKKQVRRIVLARPAVEAGEKLGFLPGDLQAKVNPYLRPLFDALEDMMDFSQMRKLIDLDIIEIIPLAFMRGRTLNESVIICDEAQNTSPLQMLMVLTRLGHGSKMIITGDVTQIDLEKGQGSGMIEAIRILKKIDGIGVVELAQADIVRHQLVQKIVQAYKKKTEQNND